MQIDYEKLLRKRKHELELLLCNENYKMSHEAFFEKLKLVDDAFSRLKEDMYGYCLNCDDEIDRGTLMKKPEATLCRTCSSQQT